MRLQSVLGSAIALMVLLPVPAARAQTVNDLFDATTLHDIQLFMNSRDLLTLRARYLEDTYYTADLLFRGIRVRNAAVRSRGATSRSPTKPALKIDFNRYTSRGQLLGLTSLVLDNALQDPSLIRERIAMAFFNRMGQPASRESYCRLFINGVYHGVYTIVEFLDTPFISQTFGDPTGFLFQYRLDDPYFGEDLGDDLAPYRLRFEPQNHDRDADSVLYTPIRELVRQINLPDDAVWLERVGQYLDLSQLVTYVAIETFLSEEDGFVGIHGMNNFFLYRSTGSNRHRLLPWDKDKVFERIDSGIFERSEENVWFRRAMAVADLRTLYLKVLEDCARSAAQDGWLLQEVLSSATVVDAAVRADVRKPFTNDEFDQAIAFFQEFAKRRSAFVLDEIARARATTVASTTIRD